MSGQNLFISSNNSFYSTGWNEFGQLGLGDNISRDTFTEINNIEYKYPIQISSGQLHCVILMNDFTFYGCGFNLDGELGLGNNANVNIFTQINSIEDKVITQIVCGYYCTFILMNDGTIYTTGWNGDGQLGLGNNIDVNNFTFMPLISGKTPIMISSGFSSTIVLMSDGTLYGTGNNTCGQLGLNNENTNVNLLTLIPSIPNKTPKSVACGEQFTIIIMTDGTLYGSGRNNNGQLGLGHNLDVNTFTEINLPIGKTPYQVSCGVSFTIILMDDGTLYGSGNNSDGQLGLGNNDDVNIFNEIPIPIGLSPIQIFCGANFTSILMDNFSIYGTGYNGRGELGISTTISVNTLTEYTLTSVPTKRLLNIQEQVPSKITPTIQPWTIQQKKVGDAPFIISNPISNSLEAFNFNSSDTNVATINGNIVTIKNSGYSNITASQFENNIYYAGIVIAILYVEPSGDVVIISNNEDLINFMNSTEKYGTIVNNLSLNSNIINNSSVIKYLTNGLDSLIHIYKSNL